MLKSILILFGRTDRPRGLYISSLLSIDIKLVFVLSDFPKNVFIIIFGHHFEHRKSENRPTSLRIPLFSIVFLVKWRVANPVTLRSILILLNGIDTPETFQIVYVCSSSTKLVFVLRIFV